MRKILILLLFSMPFFAIAQKENEDYKAVADGIIRLLNENKYQDIYDMYSPVLRKFQDAEQSKSYLEGACGKYGEIRETTFVKFQQNYGIYQAKGEKGDFLLRISIDDQRRLVGLNIAPVK